MKTAISELIRLNEYYSQIGGIGELSEATFNRILSVLNNPKINFVIISYNLEILKDIRDKYSKQIGAYKLVGHWKECSIPLEDDFDNLENLTKACLKQDGHIQDSLEESLFIRFDKGITSDILSFICSLAKKYKQEAFITRINGKLKLYSSNCDVFYTFSTASGYDALATSYKALLNKQVYSQWKNDRAHGKTRSLVLERFYGITPTTNFGKMAFKSAHLLY